MIKNKLPRKRKKAFKKAHEKGEYMMAQIINEILFEEKGTPPRFIKLKGTSTIQKGMTFLDTGRMMNNF